VFGLDICYEIPPDESVADLAKKTLNRNRSGFQPGPIDQDTQTALMSNTSGRGANDTTSTLKTFQSHKQKKNTAMTQLEFLDLNIKYDFSKIKLNEDIKVLDFVNTDLKLEIVDTMINSFAGLESVPEHIFDWFIYNHLDN